MQPFDEQIHGHHVVVQPDDADPPDSNRAVIRLGVRRFVAQLDSELGWTCPTLPFRGYASPQDLARALAASHSVDDQTG